VRQKLPIGIQDFASVRDCLLPWEGSGWQPVKAGGSFDYEKRGIVEWKGLY
jgi:hypothetical protein